MEMSYTGHFASSCPDMKIFHLVGMNGHFSFYCPKMDILYLIGSNRTFLILLSQTGLFSLSEIKNLK